MMTKNGEISNELVSKYVDDLVNRFYKILPIKESSEATLIPYLNGLQREMLGCQGLLTAFKNDDRYLTLLAILQYFIDHDPDVSVIRSDVFKSISILKKLQTKYCGKGG